MSNTTFQHPRKDYWLLFCLLIMNLVSGFTTIQGATIALGKENQGVAIMIGIVTQMLLLFLLSGYAARHAPMKKWIAAYALSFVSIYTSFFTYYTNISTETDQVGAEWNTALVAHTEFVNQVTTPLQAELNDLESNNESLNEKIERERNGLGETGQVGTGEEARMLIREQNNLQPELKMAQSLNAKIAPLLEQSKRAIEQKETSEMFTKDQEIWANIPQGKRPDPQLYKGPNRNSYFEEASRYKLLEPIFRLFQQKEKDGAAIASLVLSTLVDGIALMLGTAVEIRSRNAPFHSIASFISQIIWGGKRAIATIEHYWRQPRKPSVTVYPAQVTGANDIVTLIELRLQGRGSEFLWDFFTAVCPYSCTIDYIALKEHRKEKFRQPFLLLLAALRHPDLAWIKAGEKGKPWRFVHPDAYHEFTRWIADELVYQTKLENDSSQSNLNSDDEHHPSVISIRRPRAS